jgi:hypothetical protein
VEWESVKYETERRKKLVISYAVGIVLAGLVLGVGIPWFVIALRTMAPETGVRMFEAVAIGLTLSALVPAVALINLGGEILKRQPPHTVRAVYGPARTPAQQDARRGRMLIYLGLFAVCMSMASALTTHRFFRLYDFTPPYKSVPARGESIEPGDPPSLVPDGKIPEVPVEEVDPAQTPKVVI